METQLSQQHLDSAQRIGLLLASAGTTSQGKIDETITHACLAIGLNGDEYIAYMDEVYRVLFVEAPEVRPAFQDRFVQRMLDKA